MAKRRKPARPGPTAAAPPIKWREPRYSHKTKHITIEGERAALGLKVCLTLDPAVAVEAVNHLHEEGGGETFVLASSLLLGMDLAVRKAPHVVRRASRAWLQEVAAAVYLYLGLRLGDESGQVLDALHRAKQACAARVPEWKGYGRRDHRIFLTAFLVYSAHQKEWEKLGLLDPLARSRVHRAPDSFYKTYIKPRLRVLKENLRRPGALQLFHERRDPRLRLLDRWAG